MFILDAINKTKLYEANLFKHLYIDVYANNGYMLDSKHLKYFMHMPDSLDANKKVSFYSFTGFYPVFSLKAIKFLVLINKNSLQAV